MEFQYYITHIAIGLVLLSYPFRDKFIKMFKIDEHFPNATEKQQEFLIIIGIFTIIGIITLVRELFFV